MLNVYIFFIFTTNPLYPLSVTSKVMSILSCWHGCDFIKPSTLCKL